MNTLGQDLSHEAANTMLDFIDTDRDGKVTRQELRDYLSSR